MADQKNYVCDLTLVMRTRLLCGLYNRRAVPPRWCRFAKAYCSFIMFAFLLHAWALSDLLLENPILLVLYGSGLGQFLLSSATSLWTEDEYIYNYFNQNDLTDITLDSPMIFNRLERQLKQFLVFLSFLVAVFVGVHVLMIHSGGFIHVMIMTVSILVTELIIACSYSSKLLIMALFNARLLVLKRRLQRYGFRTTRLRQVQPYCQIYDEILQGLDATDNPLKLLLFFDVIFSCGRWIAVILSSYYDFIRNDYSLALVLLRTVTLLSRVSFCAFGNVASLESAAEHCENMAVFTATELIKNPTPEQRRHMLAFLDALDDRGARYRVMRALPLDARSVLGILGFCTAQVFLFMQSIKAN